MLTGKRHNQWFQVVMLRSSVRKLYGRRHDLADRYGMAVSYDNEYVPFVVVKIPSFFLVHDSSPDLQQTGVARRVEIVQQELFTIPDNVLSHPWFLVEFVFNR